MRIKDDEKVTRIYKAAVKVVNQDGFYGSSMAKIASEAEVSAATIYLYFENKEDMLNKLYIDLKSRLVNSYLNEETNTTPSKSLFRSIWINHYQYITNNPEEYNFLENFSNCPLIQRIDNEQKKDYCSSFDRLFDQAKSANLIKPMDNDIIYSLLFAPISSLVKKNKLQEKPISANELLGIFEASWNSICV